MLASFLPHLPAFVETALAQTPPEVACHGLPGCGNAIGGVAILTTAAVTALDILFSLVGGGSVVAIIWGGFMMVVNHSDDSRASAKKIVTHALIGLAIAGAAGSIVTTIITHVQPISGGTFDPAQALGFIAYILLTSFDAAVTIVCIIAGIRMAMAGGQSGEFQKGVTIVKWALIGAIVAHLSTALAQLLANIVL
jgi:hypothetical protein